MTADKENEYRQQLEQLTAKKLELEMENQRRRGELEAKNAPRNKKSLTAIVSEVKNERR